MTRFIHDKFAKDYLEELLKDYGMRLEPLYQRDREQAKQEGRQEGEKDLILRLLNRRIGEINASFIERVQGLSIEQLENLGEALLDFSSVADLSAWLNQQFGSP